MIPNLPRPLLWTEIKTMDEFLKGERVANLLYNNFHWLQKCHSLPVVDELVFFNELYYQLTRYYYEKPQSEDYPRYEADIKQNIGDECYVDLLMTMMYHYCRLRIASSEKLLTDGFLQVIVNNQCKKKYWSHFRTIASSGFFWLTPVPYPQKPCPVAPEKLEKMKLNWAEITKDYNLSSVQEILELWEKEDDKREVVKMIVGNIPKGYPLFKPNKSLKETYNYLKKVKRVNEEISDVSMIRAETTPEEMNFQEELEQVKKEKMVLQKRVDELKTKLCEAEKLEKNRLSEIDKWHNVSENNLSRAYEWESKYEEEVEKNKKAEYLREECEKIKQENVKLRVKIEQLKEKLDEGGIIVETAKKYLSDKPFSPDIILKRFVKDEEYEKKEKILEDKIKELQDKLGEEKVQLSVLAEGIKNYSEEASIDAAYNLFVQLNNVLYDIPAWTKNVPELKKFFRDARKEREKNITNIGQQNNFENVGSYNEKVATQNNNYPAMPFGQQGQKQLE